MRRMQDVINDQAKKHKKQPVQFVDPMQRVLRRRRGLRARRAVILNVLQFFCQEATLPCGKTASATVRPGARWDFAVPGGASRRRIIMMIISATTKRAMTPHAAGATAP